MAQAVDSFTLAGSYAPVFKSEHAEEQYSKKVLGLHCVFPTLGGVAVGLVERIVFSSRTTQIFSSKHAPMYSRMFEKSFSGWFWWSKMARDALYQSHIDLDSSLEAYSEPRETGTMPILLHLPLEESPRNPELHPVYEQTHRIHLECEGCLVLTIS